MPAGRAGVDRGAAGRSTARGRGRRSEAPWSGGAAPDTELAARAWAAEKAIRGALAEQPLRVRARAAIRYRGLTRVRDTRV